MWQIGIVVADREAAAEALSAAFGVTWTTHDRVIDITHLGRDMQVPLRLALAREGPVHLEVIEAQEGTPWWPAHGLDHVARWTSDLPGTAGVLDDAGFTLEGTYQGEPGPVGFTYHRAGSGPRIEHVDSARRRAMLDWIAGGGYPELGAPPDRGDDSPGGTDTPGGYGPTTFGIGRPFHVGFVVPDLDAAMAELTDGLGMTWHAVQDRTMHVRTPAGVSPVSLRFTYSAGDEPHIELLQGDPGSMWGPENAGFHHIGVWSSDFVGDAAVLETKGFPLELTLASRSTDGPHGFTYQSSPFGVRVELVPLDMQPAFTSWFGGGSFAMP